MIQKRGDFMTAGDREAFLKSKLFSKLEIERFKADMKIITAGQANSEYFCNIRACFLHSNNVWNAGQTLVYRHRNINAGAGGNVV